MHAGVRAEHLGPGPLRECASLAKECLDAEGYCASDRPPCADRDRRLRSSDDILLERGWNALMLYNEISAVLCEKKFQF